MRMWRSNSRTYPLRTREFSKEEGMVKHQGGGALGSRIKQEEAYRNQLMLLVDPFGCILSFLLSCCLGLLSCCMVVLSHVCMGVESRVVLVFGCVHT